MLMPERDARQLEECKYFQTVAVIIGNAEQRGVGVKRQHRDPEKFEVRTSYKRTLAGKSAKSVFADMRGCTAHVYF